MREIVSSAERVLARWSDTPTQVAGTSLATAWAVGTDGLPLQTGGNIRQSWLCHKTTDFGMAGPQGQDVIGDPQPGLFTVPEFCLRLYHTKPKR